MFFLIFVIFTMVPHGFTSRHSFIFWRLTFISTFSTTLARNHEKCICAGWLASFDCECFFCFFSRALKQSVFIRQARRFPASSGSTQWKMKRPREAVNPLGNGLLCLSYWFESLKINEVMTYWWAAVVSLTSRGWYLIMTFYALFLLPMFMRVSSHV